MKDNFSILLFLKQVKCSVTYVHLTWKHKVHEVIWTNVKNKLMASKPAVKLTL